MRQPRAPSALHHVLNALALPKELDATREGVLAAASKPDGFECGSKRYRWRVDISTARNVLLARLTCDGAVVLNLDHHATPGRIAPGYHWDVRPPLLTVADRIYIEPQPQDVEAALEYLRVFWNLVFIRGTERLL